MLLSDDPAKVLSKGPWNQYCSRTWSRKTGSAARLVILQRHREAAQGGQVRLSATMLECLVSMVQQDTDSAAVLPAKL